MNISARAVSNNSTLIISIDGVEIAQLNAKDEGITLRTLEGVNQNPIRKPEPQPTDIVGWFFENEYWTTEAVIQRIVKREARIGKFTPNANKTTVQEVLFYSYTLQKANGANYQDKRDDNFYPQPVYRFEIVDHYRQNENVITQNEPRFIAPWHREVEL